MGAAVRDIRVKLPQAFDFLFQEKADDGSQVRFRAAHGGRAGAKSHSFCGALTQLGFRQPLRIGCFREIQKSIRDSVKQLIDDKIAEYGLTDFYESTDTEIRGRNGTRFIFGGLRSGGKGTLLDAVKSTEGLDIAAVFEARGVSQRSLDVLIPTVRKPGSEVWFEWNPEDEKDPVDAMFRGPGSPPPGSIVREVSYRDNPWFSDELRRDMEYVRRRDYDKYKWIWEGGYLQNGEARVFKNWVVESFDAPSNATLRFGGDWGFSVDPTVLVRCFIGRWENGRAIADDDGRHLFIDYEAYQVGCEIDDTPALFDSVPGSRRFLITADSARPETVSYVKRQGFKIVAAIKGQGSVEDGVAFLKSYDIVVHPRCVHVIGELSSYSYKVDKLTGHVLPMLEDKDNNCIDATRYALEGARRAVQAAKAKPKPRMPAPVAAGGWMAR